MNKEIFKGNWNIVKGKLKQQWGKLTDDDIAKINGSYDELVGYIEKRYGMKKEQVEKQIETFMMKAGIKEQSTF